MKKVMAIFLVVSVCLLTCLQVNAQGLITLTGQNLSYQKNNQYKTEAL